LVFDALDVVVRREEAAVLVLVPAAVVIDGGLWEDGSR
jgi:hypothetical protein